MSPGRGAVDTGTGAFVGRADALADLDLLVQRAEAGRGAFALVTGEPGIGKTTLVEQAAGSRRVLWGRAAEHVGAPLGLWRQIASAAATAGIALDAGVDLAGAGGAAGGTGAERFLRFDAVIAGLREAARTDPFVVVLDDLQWADRDSCALLELLVGELDRLPIAVIGTTRPDAVSDLPRAALTIELTGLTAPEVRTLVASFSGGLPDDAVVDAALELTGGNPFFLGEVARHLRTAGAALEATSWRGVLPQGVRSLLSRQLAALDPAAGTAARAAAVLGTSFDVNELAAVLDTARADAYVALDPIVAAGLVHDAGDGTFAFAHALVRDAALADLDLATRHDLHVRSAEVLVALHGDTAAAAIAAHYAAAGNRERAAEWWERAGERAYDAAMYADACECFTAAVAASAAPARVTLQLRLAESLSRAGDIDRARQLFVEVARSARAARDTPALARAALGVGAIGGGFEIRMLDVEQIALLEEVLANADARGEVRSRIAARLSVALTLASDHARRVALAAEAVEMARAAGDDAALVHAIAAWCDAHASPAHIDARLHATEEMLAAASRSGDPELELLTRRFRIVALMESGEVAPATAEIRAFARLADSLRQPAFQWYARVVEGMLALLHGDVAAAERLGTIAQDAGRRAQSGNAEMLAGGLLAMVYRERGDNDACLRAVAAGNAGHDEATHGYDFMYPLFLVGYGVEPATVVGILGRLPDDLDWADNDALYLMVWSTMGDAAAMVADTARMDTAWKRLEPFASRFALDGTAAVCYGPVSATLARIAHARGDTERARHLYEDALDALTPIDAPLLRSRLEREVAALGRPAPPRPPVVSLDAARFEREGEVWALAFGGASTRLRDAKGLRDLAVLLARPDGEVHALDLVAASEGHGRSDRVADADVGPALDARARGAYEQRIRDLTELIEEADAANDIGRAARLDDERAELLRELGAALGLSGRARSQSSDAERARKAVTMRIRDAIARIDRELPALGSHLRNSVRTGIFCSYRPEQPVEWRL